MLLDDNHWKPIEVPFGALLIGWALGLGRGNRDDDEDGAWFSIGVG